MKQGGNGKQRPGITAVGAQRKRVDMDRELAHAVLASSQAAMAARERELLGAPDAAIKPPAPSVQELLEYNRVNMEWVRTITLLEIADRLAAQPSGLSGPEAAAMSSLITGKG